MHHRLLDLTKTLVIIKDSSFEKWYNNFKIKTSMYIIIYTKVFNSSNGNFNDEVNRN